MSYKQSLLNLMKNECLSPEAYEKLTLELKEELIKENAKLDAKAQRLAIQLKKQEEEDQKGFTGSGLIFL